MSSASCKGNQSAEFGFVFPDDLHKLEIYVPIGQASLQLIGKVPFEKRMSTVQLRVTENKDPQRSQVWKLLENGERSGGTVLIT